jgi:hypothetical protein
VAYNWCGIPQNGLGQMEACSFKVGIWNTTTTKYLARSGYGIQQQLNIEFTENKSILAEDG